LIEDRSAGGACVWVGLAFAGAFGRVQPRQILAAAYQDAEDTLTAGWSHAT
jgi:hypothetical protein